MTIFSDVETRGFPQMELIETDLLPYEDIDDGKDRKAHYVNEADNIHIWQPGMSPQDIIDAARLTGQWVFALCGYKFIPERDPQKYQVCSACADIGASYILADG